MKQKLLLILILIASIVPLPTLARDFTYEYEGQTLTYTVIDEEAKTCETKAGSHSEAGNTISGQLSIPDIAEDESGNKYTVTTISYCAFWCYRLTSVTIPNSVTSIGDYAFSKCRGLTSITIPNSVISIGSAAFFECEALTEVHISSLESWCKIDFVSSESNPLYYAQNLYLNGELVKDLIIPESMSEIKKDAFSGCSGLTSVTIPNSVTSIGTNAFSGCSGLTSITIPNSVTSIGSWAFYGCSGLTSITIPNSVTSIGSYAFSGCRGLTSVTIPNSVTSIGDFAFYWCPGLTSVTIGNSVTEIGEYAFSNCSGLTSVTIGNSVLSLGQYVFRDCSNLSEIISLNPEPPTSIDPGKEALVFNYANRKAKLRVPAGSEQAYKESPVWSGFSDIVGFAVDTSGITLDNSILELTIGQNITLSATITPDNTTDKTVTWSSSNPTIASVDNNGKVTALAAGTTTITATTSNGLTATCTVTVVPQTGTIDGIDYEIVIGSGEDGKDVVKVTGGKTDPDGNLRIPDEIEIDGKKYPVTEIGDGAFKNRTDIRKLIIPATVVKVGN